MSTQIKLDSSPGVPLMKYANTNQLLFEGYADYIADLVADRMSAIYKDRGESSSIEAINSNLCDPIRVFIKQEPHKREKMDEGRFRIISSVSVVDQIIDRMIFGKLNDSEIENWKNIPFKVGTGLSTDKQVEELEENIRSYFDTGFTTDDQSGWDWSFKEWNFRSEANLRIMLMYDCSFCDAQKIDTPFAVFVRARLKYLSNSIFCTSDGVLWSQGKKGKMKSGSLITLRTNCSQRTVTSLIVSNNYDKQFAVTMGDDCVETTFDSMIDSYAEYGFKLTDVKHHEVGDYKPIEFCSHDIINGIAIPQNAAKSFYKFLHSPHRKEPMQQQQLLSDLRHSPHFHLVLNLIGHLRCEWQNNNGKQN